jgi:hypothetical protein
MALQDFEFPLFNPASGVTLQQQDQIEAHWAFDASTYYAFISQFASSINVSNSAYGTKPVSNFFISPGLTTVPTSLATQAMVAMSYFEMQTLPPQNMAVKFIRANQGLTFANIQIERYQLEGSQVVLSDRKTLGLDVMPQDYNTWIIDLKGFFSFGPRNMYRIISLPTTATPVIPNYHNITVRLTMSDRELVPAGQYSANGQLMQLESSSYPNFRLTA